MGEKKKLDSMFTALRWNAWLNCNILFGDHHLEVRVQILDFMFPPILNLAIMSCQTASVQLECETPANPQSHVKRHLWIPVGRISNTFMLSCKPDGCVFLRQIILFYLPNECFQSPEAQFSCKDETPWFEKQNNAFFFFISLQQSRAEFN